MHERIGLEVSMAEVYKRASALEASLDRAKELLKEDSLSRGAMLLLAGLMVDLQIRNVANVNDAIDKITREIELRKQTERGK
jgi:hypothetical protein